ncbi:CLUMA_CG014875, isoform A [Clunio marinus]|uniref:Fibroblast growth factor n=1 Tax=Clunio marinus TaxID=568069 RepID=A0A1J1IQ39_9DIPT|nr:CLUMA_CG014875, isoform A [Clunio marinus]
MNSCGAIYGSAEFTDDCVFNESMEQHHYNTYSSTYHSNAKRKLYLGLNRHGQPRKIQLPATRPLGKLSIYTKTLTKTVAQAQVEALIARLFGPNRVKHGLKQLCDTGNVLQNIIAKGLKAKPKCNSSVKPNRKKKRKRKCRIDEPEGVECLKETSSSISQYHNNTKPNNSINIFNNKRKSTSGNQNQHQRKCITNDDCGSQKGNRKKPPFIKKNNQIKFSSSSNSNSNHKPKSRKKLTKTSTKSTTTTSTPDDIDQDVDKDEAFTSDELEDEDYDDVNLSAAGHSINLIDDHMIDDYNN